MNLDRDSYGIGNLMPLATALSGSYVVVARGGRLPVHPAVLAWRFPSPQPGRNDRRTCRSGLSTFTSTSAIDCQVPSASRPLITGTVA